MRAASIGLLAIALAASTGAAANGGTMMEVKPSAIDPRVKAFDDPNVVISPEAATAATPIALFLPGTGGRPANAADLLGVIAGQGYRVIGLEYDDDPAVAQVCPKDPDPNCSADFRQMRAFGDGPSRAVHNPAAEAISARLVALLTALDKQRPGEGWGAYLKDGQPDWSRFVVSGLSQGAGMAAYIAMKHPVARVVLFSSPWDFTGPDKRPAPWLSEASATPMDRWYAEYHARENTVPLIRRAYAALRIPPDHIRVFNRDIPDRFSRAAQNSPNPFHGLTVRDTGYGDDWRALYGRPGS